MLYVTTFPSLPRLSCPLLLQASSEFLKAAANVKQNFSQNPLKRDPKVRSWSYESGGGQAVVNGRHTDVIDATPVLVLNGE